MAKRIAKKGVEAHVAAALKAAHKGAPRQASAARAFEDDWLDDADDLEALSNAMLDFVSRSTERRLSLARLTRALAKTAHLHAEHEAVEVLLALSRSLDPFARKRTKTALGRNLVEAIKRGVAQQVSEEKMIRRVVFVVKMGQEQVGILRGVPREELLERVAVAFKKGLPEDAEKAAATVLRAAGMAPKAAHNLVNAAPNMAVLRKGADV